MSAKSEMVMCDIVTALKLMDEALKRLTAMQPLNEAPTVILARALLLHRIVTTCESIKSRDTACAILLEASHDSTKR